MSRSISLLCLVPMLCLTTGCQQLGGVGEFSQRVANLLTGKTPVSAVKKMEDPRLADQRRQGIYELVSQPFGKRPPYTERYRQIARSDADFTVRAAALRALNVARDREATSLFIAALEDPNDWVRLEAAKALANMPDESAVAPLARIVANVNDNKDVRVAAADALRHYRSIQVARALIAALGARDFGVAWQARQSLVRLTGKDLRYDEGAWLELITGPDRPFG